MEFPQKISIEPDYIASACLMSLQPSLGKLCNKYKKTKNYNRIKNINK